MNAAPDSGPIDALAERIAVWTRHWATGAPHSCVGSYGDRYGGATAEFWKAVFAPLRSAQRVLDLATGSGAVPRLLLELCPDTVCEVDAVDLAAIEPAWLTTQPPAVRARVRFRGGQAIEALPFADATFDLVVSQYGLEYSDLDRSIPELLRVLAPNGRVALLMHANDSRPVTLAATELAHIDWLLSADGLLSCAAAMLEPLSRAATPAGRASLASDSAAEAARVQFNAAQAALAARARIADGADILHETQDAVAVALDMAIGQSQAMAREHVRRLGTALQDAHLRLSQLRQCALNRQALEALGQTLQCGVESDAKLAIGEVVERGHVMAHTLCVGPPDD
jgi:SAM-dependent methyltransferase